MPKGSGHTTYTQLANTITIHDKKNVFNTSHDRFHMHFVMIMKNVVNLIPIHV